MLSMSGFESELAALLIHTRVQLRNGSEHVPWLNSMPGLDATADRLIDETDAGLRARMRAHAVPPDGMTPHEKLLAHVGEQISLAICGDESPHHGEGDRVDLSADEVMKAADALARHRAEEQADFARYELEAAAHPATQDCPDAECDVCAFRDCPHHETLHYHHDGCPACHGPERSVP